MDVRLLSEPRGTIVVAECEGFRERASDERVHLLDDGETCCQRCFASGSLVWTDNVERWAQHAARCEVMP
jgi:hypothetical protein